jgi:hypothetical protein
MSKYAELCKEISTLEKRMNVVEAELAAERKRLRALVKVEDKYSTFTQLQYKGRKLNVKYNRYGDETVTEKGKKIDTSLRTTGRIRPSINDLRLLLALGRI